MMAGPLKIATIVLAAGRSARMAPRNKLLELVEGKPVIAHTAIAALGSGADPVIVVTGFAAASRTATTTGETTATTTATMTAITTGIAATTTIVAATMIAGATVTQAKTRHAR